MYVILNQKIIKRSKSFSRTCFYGFLSFLTLGVVFTIYPITDFRSINLIISLFLLLVCYILLRINMSMASRWDVRPRIDEKLSSALKGLPEEFCLYHYIAYNAHVLVGPTQVWLLDTSDYGGEVFYDKSKNKWLSKRSGNFLEKLVRTEKFADLEKSIVQEHLAWLKTLSYIKKKVNPIDLEDAEEPHYVMVLLNDKAMIRSENKSDPIVKVDKVKEYIRKQSGSTSQQTTSIKQLNSILMGS